jgi:ATP-dependent helicase/nuclease subunit A
MINIKDLPKNDIISPQYQNKDIILQGIADMIFEENNELVIIDYKTDYAVSETELIEKYSNQLIIYKLAFEKIENKKVKECIIYSFGLGKCISII